MFIHVISVVVFKIDNFGMFIIDMNGKMGKESIKKERFANISKIDQLNTFIAFLSHTPPLSLSHQYTSDKKC